VTVVRSSDDNAIRYVLPVLWMTMTSCFHIMGMGQIRDTTTTTPQLFYGPFSGATQVSRCQKRTSRLYGARWD